MEGPCTWLVGKKEGKEAVARNTCIIAMPVRNLL